MEHWTYLFVNLGAISIPFLFSFHPKLRFDKTWPAFLFGCIITTSFFIIWDIIFTDWGIWGFNPQYLLGIDIVNLPLEEWLFFICIPYACVFTYHCLNILIPKDILGKYASGISLGLVTFLIPLAFIHLDKWYTSTTFLLLAAFLLAQIFIFKPQFLGRFYLSYIAILPFFFLTNGILTGSGIEEQVVWYNDLENLGIRMGTIPVEDSMYGLLMLMMNVVLYEHWLKRSGHKKGH